MLQCAYLPKTLEEATAILQALGGVPLTVLGWGSNTILASAGVAGATFITRNMTETRIDPATGRTYFGAGVFLGQAATLVAKAGLAGAEFWVGIPGTIGGALRMNAGAMGADTAQHCVRAWVYHRVLGQVQEWAPAQMGFRYRHSAIDPTYHVVLGAEFQFAPVLAPDDTAGIQRRMEENIQFRRAHHPTEPNAGSVFQNPHPEAPAGKLLDALGAKTWEEGGVRISPRHANFIINTGGGTSLDVLRLMRRMQLAIETHYGLRAMPENILLGDALAEEQDLWWALTDINHTN
jgi:UDP-N-acetylmuramate dehydrogenase